MKRSEFNAKLDELFGDEDVEIYFESWGEHFGSDFRILIDEDSDCVIKP